MFNYYKLSDYQYDLPQELIAQTPITPRDHSRLMVIDRKTGKIQDRHFYDLAEYLNAGDQIVFNDTKVIPARLIGRKTTGARVEFLLNRMQSEYVWDVMARPGRKLPPATQVEFSDALSAEILEELPDGMRRVRFTSAVPFFEILDKTGQMPLPPYIERVIIDPNDRTRYQTIYANSPGAVAAPTAGLHFTPELLNKIVAKGVTDIHVTLHVGMGTFKPVQTDDIRDHHMHQETVTVSSDAALKLNDKKVGAKRFAVGTTSCRSLESAASASGLIGSGNIETSLFIYPGYHFRSIDALLTNFHLPGSSLLMLVSAFGGYELIQEAYAHAIKEKYRFFSYGDAMLLI